MTEKEELSEEQTGEAPTQEATTPRRPALSEDDDLDEPLGEACDRENPECESCQ